MIFRVSNISLENILILVNFFILDYRHARFFFMFDILMGENLGNRSKDPGNKPPRQKPPRQKSPDNKPPRMFEEIIAKFAVDTNLFRLESTNPKKKSSPWVFFFLILGFYTGAYCHGAFIQEAFDQEPPFIP